MATVYLETSFFSECVTIRKGVIDLGRRATSLHWWNNHSKFYDLFISAEVVRELSAPDFPENVRQPALDMLKGLSAVALDDSVIAFSEILVREKVMPGPAFKGDALHLAAAAIHRLDFLVTWNQQHLANPNKRTHFAVVCYRMNLPAPQIVTPDLLMTEVGDE